MAGSPAHLYITVNFKTISVLDQKKVSHLQRSDLQIDFFPLKTKWT